MRFVYFFLLHVGAIFFVAAYIDLKRKDQSDLASRISPDWDPAR